VKDRAEREPESAKAQETEEQAPDILEEIEIEEFAVDGICGVY
jgi:mycofactocin precursor